MQILNSTHYNNIMQGIKNEEIILEVIKQKWNLNKLEKTHYFHPIDFVDENDIYYEVKSRNINYNKYPTTMIGVNKLQYVKKHNLECYFIFSFTDGNYYYKFNKDDELITNIGGRKDRGKAEYKPYVYIPINKLIKI